MTTKLLGIFQRDHIQITGFVNEYNRSEELRPLLRLWVAAGADLGNHACSHPDLNKMSVTDFKSQIVQDEAIATEILGHRQSISVIPFCTNATPLKKKLKFSDF